MQSILSVLCRTLNNVYNCNMEFVKNLPHFEHLLLMWSFTCVFWDNFACRRIFILTSDSLIGLFVEVETRHPSEQSQLSTTEVDRYLTETNVMPSIPNLLDPRISVDGTVELQLPESVSDRLAMLGGVSGILAQMDRDKAKPDVKTFSLLLDMMPLSLDAETDLLSAMNFYNVQADVDFYNMLIRKKNLRGDFAGANVRWSSNTLTYYIWNVY